MRIGVSADGHGIQLKARHRSPERTTTDSIRKFRFGKGVWVGELGVRLGSREGGVQVKSS